MMKNPRIIAGILILVLSMTLMGVLSKMKGVRKPNVYGQEWKAVFEFIRTADKVETAETTSAGYPFMNMPADVTKYLASADPSGHHKVQIVPRAKRDELVALLKKLPDTEVGVAACFCPHHFISATKGTEKIELAMCFHCSSILVGGSLKLTSGLRDDLKTEVSNVFGMDIFPDLGDAKCEFNPGDGQSH